MSIGNEKVREKTPIREVYENESFFYNVTFPTFEKFQQEAKVTHPFKSVPKFYKSDITNLKELLVFENLRTLGFEVLEKSSLFDDEHISKLVQEYAKLHALSYALKNRKPDLYKKLCSEIQNPFDKGHLDDFIKMFSKMVQNAADIFEDKEDENVKNTLEKFSSNCPSHVRVMLDEDKDRLYNCVLHGDCWSNNIMFKYEETELGKQLKEIKLLDWQLSRIGSPVNDLAYLIYAGGSKEIFANLNKYLSLYHKKLAEFYLELGGDLECLITLEQLKDDWKKYTLFNISFAIMVAGIKLTKTEDVKDFSDVKDDNVVEGLENITEIRCDKTILRQRLRDIISHLQDIKVL